LLALGEIIFYGHHSCPGRKANGETREPNALLSNDDIRLGRIASFAEIVEREAQGERHVRWFAPHLLVAPYHSGDRRWRSAADLTVNSLLRLPWLAPDITMAIINGRKPPQLTAQTLDASDAAAAGRLG
jgi:hypothetical protein